MKLGDEELFPHLRKFKDLEAQGCPVSFHREGEAIHIKERKYRTPFEG